MDNLKKGPRLQWEAAAFPASLGRFPRPFGGICLFSHCDGRAATLEGHSTLQFLFLRLDTAALMERKSGNASI